MPGRLMNPKLSQGYVPYMPLRYVDPNKKRGRVYKVMEHFGRSRPGHFSRTM